MSREIKFRAWHKEHKKMYGCRSVNFHHGQCGLVGFGMELWERLELMQFTGLKDKNGKEEVYEDDLMKDLLHIYRVVWKELSATFTLIDVQEPLNQLRGGAIRLLTKIGNIHTDPNLME